MEGFVVSGRVISVMAAAKQSADSDGVRMTYGELQKRIADFIRESADELSEESIGTYRRTLNELERWVQAGDGEFEFVPEQAAAYRDYLSDERGLSSVSVSTYLTGLRRFCNYLVDIGVLDENPAQAVRGNARPAKHTRAVLEDGEIQALLDAVGGPTALEKRDAAIVYLMLFAGLSEIEVARADIGDLEQTLMGWYLRVQGKGRTEKDQRVPVDDSVMERIRIYLDARGRIRPEQPLVVSHGRRSEDKRLNTRSIRGRISGLLKAAKVGREEVTPHSLTHTAAILWLKSGMSEEEVKRRMRHGTIDTTRIYSRQVEV